MLSLIVDFTSLMLAALLVGAMFCAWLFLNPSHLNPAQYVILQQQGIRALHPSMPPLGALTIATTLIAAFLARHNSPRMGLLIAAAILFIISGIITRSVNMPINASVIQWSSSAPPENWTQFRDTWWRWHRLRTVLGVAALALLILAGLARGTASAQTLASLRGCALFNVLMQAMCLLI